MRQRRAGLLCLPALTSGRGCSERAVPPEGQCLAPPGTQGSLDSPTAVTSVGRPGVFVKGKECLPLGNTHL